MSSFSSRVYTVTFYEVSGTSLTSVPGEEVARDKICRDALVPSFFSSLCPL